MQKPKDCLLSFIIPVYNRPVEIDELLSSLTQQTCKRFEVVIIEDGSTDTCLSIVEKYQELLPICYQKIPNGGPSRARNIGTQYASTDFFIFLDSDVILPQSYVEIVANNIESMNIDAFGGPDNAHHNFSNLQKAINYSMTSFITTGGIRGRKNRVDRFYPRTFNLGCKKSIFKAINGFDEQMRFGEDIDFSLRMYKEGANVVLLEEAWVYHKRRVDFRKFFKQVYNSGIARIHLAMRHKGSLKLVHILPSLATFFLLCCVVLGFFYPYTLGLILLAALIIFLDAYRTTHNLKVSLLAIIAAFIQIVGYGTGFCVAAFRRIIFKGNEFSAFNDTFYN